MKSKRTTFILIAAFALLCVAGTKLSRMTRTRNIDANSRFYVVTQAVDGTFHSRWISAPDLGTNLSRWSTNSGGGGSATNAVSVVKTNGVNVVSGSTSIDFIAGTNIVLEATNTAGAVSVQINARGEVSTAQLLVVSNQFNVASNQFRTELAELQGYTNVNVGSIVYVRTNGNDSTAVRGRPDKPFLTLTAAKNAAATGDMIDVGPGQYNYATNLAKSVTYKFNRSILTMTNTTTTANTRAMFDDAGGTAVDLRLIGDLTIHHHVREEISGSVYTMLMTNPASSLAIDGLKLYVSCTNAGSILYSIYTFNGDNTFLNIDLIEDTERSNTSEEFGGHVDSNTGAFYWERGNPKGRIGHMLMDNGYCVYGNEPVGGATNSLYLTGDRWESLRSPAVYVASVSTNYAIWLDAKEIISTNEIALSAIGPAKWYVRSQKLSGLVIADGGASWWIESMKATLTGNSSYFFRNVIGPEAYVNIQHYQSLGNVVTGFEILGAGRYVFDGGDWPSIPNANAVPIYYSGPSGNTEFKSMRINASAVTVPAVRVESNGLTLTACTIFSGSSSNSVFAPSARTVNLDGSSILMPGVHANVSLTGPGTNYYGAAIHYGPATAQTFAVFDGNKNISGTVPTNAFPTHAQLVTASNSILSAARSSDIVTSNSLVTLSSNNVRVVAGTGGGSVDTAGSGGVQTYTVNFPAGGTGSLTTLRTNAGVAGTNLVALLLTNAPVASPVQFQVNSNAAVATISAQVANLSGSGNVAASNTPTLFNATLLGTTTTDDLEAAFFQVSGNSFFGSDISITGGASVGGISVFNGEVNINRDLIIPWEFGVAGGVVYATNGPNQIYTLGVHTNLAFAPLSGSDASNSVAIRVTFTQNTTGGYYATNNAATIFLRTNANASTDVYFWLQNGVTNFSVDISLTQTNPASGHVWMYDEALGGYRNQSTTGSGNVVRSGSPSITGTATIEATIQTNGTGYVIGTIAGVGGANTNFTGHATDGVKYLNGGLTNVNFVAVMPGTAGLQYFPTYIISNLTTTARNISFSRVTNRWVNLQQYHGTTDPLVLSNKHTGILALSMEGTNTFWSFIQCTNGF